MFDDFMNLITWVLDSATSVWETCRTGMGFIGVMILGMPIIKKVVTLMRKIF